MHVILTCNSSTSFVGTVCIPRAFCTVSLCFCSHGQVLLCLNDTRLKIKLYALHAVSKSFGLCTFKQTLTMLTNGWGARALSTGYSHNWIFYDIGQSILCIVRWKVERCIVMHPINATKFPITRSSHQNWKKKPPTAINTFDRELKNE